MDWITIATIVSAGATATAAWIAWEHLKHEKTSSQTTRHIMAAPTRTPPVTPAPLAFPTTYGATSNASLESEVGADYRPLQDLLAAQRFEEADQETWRVMLWVADREKERWLDVEDIEQFPCRDLQTIDRLWVQHSNGRFGFSVQKRIYNEVGKDFFKLANRVGWRKREDLIGLVRRYYKFELRAPLGHLPALMLTDFLCVGQNLTREGTFFLGWWSPPGISMGEWQGVRVDAERKVLFCLLFSRVETCRL